MVTYMIQNTDDVHILIRSSTVLSLLRAGFLNRVLFFLFNCTGC